VTESTNSDWNTLVGLISELKRCDENNITTASVAMSYICIDTLANLARPEGKESVTRSDFKNLVDHYLSGHPDQPYQYRGKDVYAARCAFLHTYGSEARLHSEDTDTIKFAYHDGGKHLYNPDVEPNLVLIGVKSFVNDVVHAMGDFLEECKRDPSLLSRVEPRLKHVLGVTPMPTGGGA